MWPPLSELAESGEVSPGMHSSAWLVWACIRRTPPQLPYLHSAPSIERGLKSCLQVTFFAALQPFGDPEWHSMVYELDADFKPISNKFSSRLMAIPTVPP